MNSPLAVGHTLLLATPLVLLEVIWFRMVVRRILLTPQVAPATR